MKTTFIILLSAILVFGCAQTPSSITTSWTPHQEQLENLSDWTLSGKIALITPRDRHSLNIHWAQSGDDFHITLTTFLGSTVLDIRTTPLGTEIINNNGEHFLAQDAEALIEQLSGLVIPIDLLQQWIKGNPKAASYQLNESNQVQSLSGRDRENSLWTVIYSNYQRVNRIDLPHKIELQRLDLRLKFAIAKWDVK